MTRHALFLPPSFLSPFLRPSPHLYHLRRASKPSQLPIIMRFQSTSTPSTRSHHAYSIAPMMEVTDRHFRALTRLISRHATLYTEMVVDRTLIHNPKLRDYSLRIPPVPNQHPVVLQLGGSEPTELEAAAKIAAEYGYTEVNLNCGCPSPKVAGKGCFGAALMRTPKLVAESTKRMKEILGSDVDVTVKCRIGVDDHDSYEGLSNFVQVVHEEGGVDHFIIHARKAILGGLSPAQNRTVPPLKYGYVYRLVTDFPGIRFSINGGIKTIEEVVGMLERGVYGVMVGRAVMDRPWHALCDVDCLVFGDEWGRDGGLTRRRVIEAYLEYGERELLETGGSVRMFVRPLLNLFHGEPNGKRFRRAIDDGLRYGLSLREIVDQACTILADSVLDALPPSMAETENDVMVEKLVVDERVNENDFKVKSRFAEVPVVHQSENGSAWLAAKMDNDRLGKAIHLTSAE